MKNKGIYENKIKELLSKMTLEEKIGQLQQVGPSLVGAFDVSFEELLDMMFDGKISHEEFEKLMGTAEQDFHEEDLKAGKIGSYNGIGDSETANRLQKIAVEETRLGIPLIFGYDVIHGFKTVTPIPLAESCAWDTDLWQETARIAAEESTSAGIHMTFAPMVDVSKDARWGRVSEGAGEDVLLNSLYGAAKVKGFQGNNLKDNDSMIACVKHFAAYGACEAGRDYNRVDMSMQKLWEEYLPSYKACIDAGARAIMPAFNDINGVPCSVNTYLLQDILRDKWNFTGMTVSDANAIAECVNHGIAEDRKNAARQAIVAGMDMDMSSNVYHDELKKLIENGELNVSYLDKAVSDILRVKFEKGLFDNPYITDKEREDKTILTDEKRALARKAAQKSIVLLKNDGILPLKEKCRIGLAGALANDKGEMLGAWAIGGDTEKCVSIKDAFDNENIAYTFDVCISDGEIDQDAVNRLTDNSDVIIAAVGERKDQSGEAASRADITVSDEQIELVKTLISTGKPVVIILFNGRPLAIPYIAENAQAVVEAWHPGIEAGNALLDILFGRINPSAKLTTTFPYTSGQCPMYYAHINTGRPGGKSKFTSKYIDTPLEPVYPFGYGLSYTTFKYENMTVKKAEDSFIVSVDVANVGHIAGEEIIQCYMHDVAAQRVRPVKQLVDFEKRMINPDEKVNVEFKIPFDKIGYYDFDMNYIIEKGEFIFYVGGNSVDCLKCNVQL